MDNKNNFIDLMAQMLLTNSPSVRLNALYEFLRQEPDYLTKEQSDHLISLFKTSKEAKSKSGLTDAQKRWNTKKAKKNNPAWLFFEKSDYGKFCSHCNKRYEINDPVFVDSATSNGYHPECVSDSVRQEQIFYQKFVSKKG